MKKDLVTITLDCKGLNRQLELAQRRNPQKTVEKVKAIVLHLAGKSAEMAPIETGDLRSNCHADINDITVFEKENLQPNVVSPSTNVEAIVGYSLPYALRQHEELGYNHTRTDGKVYNGKPYNTRAGGEAKYLENPFRENEQRYANILRAIPGEVIDEVTGERRSSKIKKV